MSLTGTSQGWALAEVEHEKEWVGNGGREERQVTDRAEVCLWALPSCLQPKAIIHQNALICQWKHWGCKGWCWSEPRAVSLSRSRHRGHWLFAWWTSWHKNHGGLDWGLCGWRCEGFWGYSKRKRAVGSWMSSLPPWRCPLHCISLVCVVVDMLLIRERYCRCFLFALSSFSSCQNLITSTGDLIHPDSVQDIQGYAGGDPCHLGTQA